MGRTTNPPSNATYHNALFVPFVVLVLFTFISWSGVDSGPFQILFGITALVCSAIYCYQLKFLKYHIGKHRLVSTELYLLLGLVLVPTAAFLIGDIQGASTFNSTPNANIANAIMLPLSIAIVASSVLGMGNSIYIASKGTSKLLNILGNICYVLLWLACFVASYFIYAIAYSVHDPSTE